MACQHWRGEARVKPAAAAEFTAAALPLCRRVRAARRCGILFATGSSLRPVNAAFGKRVAEDSDCSWSNAVERQ